MTDTRANNCSHTVNNELYSSIVRCQPKRSSNQLPSLTGSTYEKLCLQHTTYYVKQYTIHIASKKLLLLRVDFCDVD